MKLVMKLDGSRNRRGFVVVEYAKVILLLAHSYEAKRVELAVNAFF